MKTPEPKLIHPLLRKIPLHVRFGLNGLLTNVLVRIYCSHETNHPLRCSTFAYGFLTFFLGL